jgi:hypothetical protein
MFLHRIEPPVWRLGRDVFFRRFPKNRARVRFFSASFRPQFAS